MASLHGLKRQLCAKLSWISKRCSISVLSGYAFNGTSKLDQHLHIGWSCPATCLAPALSNFHSVSNRRTLKVSLTSERWSQ